MKPAKPPLMLSYTPKEPRVKEGRLPNEAYEGLLENFRAY